MTDNEIIKALKICSSEADAGWCDICPYEGTVGSGCSFRLISDTIALINRQKEEIERLKKDKYLLVKDNTVTIIPRTDIRILSTEEVERLRERLKESGILDRPVVIAENPEVEMVGGRE